MIKFEINQSAGPAMSRPMVQRWLSKITKVLKIKTSIEISLGVVGAAAIRKMNKLYRGQDKVTDVLSFAEINSGRQRANQGYIGEIIICYPQALRRANQFGHTINQELELLFVHAFMHLLGYDHKNAIQANQMEKLEEKILSHRG